MATDELHARLTAIVGAAHVRPPAQEELTDATRWAGLHGSAALLVAPGDAEQVAAVVACCYAAGVPITPRGGGTGLAGGAVPDGGVVLSLARLNRVRSLDPEWWRVEVEAGVTTAALQRRVGEVGLRFPPDPGAAQTSTIGGNLATNAGGPMAFGHGVTGRWVLGVEAVLAPGELVRIGGPVRKDVAGYDLTALLVGSEGTLGIITAAWLRLVPPPHATRWVAAALDGPHRVQDGVAAALVSGTMPVALELLDAATLRHSAATLPWPEVRAAVAPGRDLLLAAIEGDSEPAVARRAAELADSWRQSGAAWAGVFDVASVAELKRWRDGISGAVAAVAGGKLSEDVAVPVDRIAELLAGVAEIAAEYRLRHATWGHAGDGNLHASFLLDPADAEQLRAAERAADALFALAAELGGTISGEHGLGRLKSGRLGLQWGAPALSMHRRVKAALDPAGLFAPGRKEP